MSPADPEGAAGPNSFTRARGPILTATLVALMLVAAGCGGGEPAGKQRPHSQAIRRKSEPRRSYVVVTGARRTGWSALRRAPSARTEVAAARVGDAVYVAGGFDADTGSSTAAVDRLDLRSGRWSVVRPMPAALNHAVAVGYHGALYVLGGYRSMRDTSTEPSAALWRYDPGPNRWTALPSAPAPRAAFAAGVVAGRFYAAGGRRDGPAALADVDVFDFAARRWSRAPDLTVAREHTAGAVSGGAFYVLGGRSSGVAVAAAERYAPGSRRWERIAALPAPRSGAAAAGVGRRPVLVGGVTGGAITGAVDSFDPASGTWRALRPMAKPRHGLGVVAVGPVLLALDGGPSPGLSFSARADRLRVR